MQRIDLAGERFGLLNVVGYERTAPRGVALWLCRCECGRERVVASGNLRNGHTSSCGSCIKLGNLRPKKYEANDHYFENIDDSEKAYFLGLLYADGCNYEPTHQVILSLNEVDGALVHAFGAAVGYTGTLSRPRSQGYAGKRTSGETFQTRIAISSRQMSADLCRHGCGAQKTFNLKFPTTVPTEYLRHFVRGYFDGDGFCTPWRGTGSSHVGVCSTLAFCRGLKAAYREHGIEFKIRPNHSIYTAYVNRMDDLATLHHLMYEDATVFLERKRRKFDQVIARVPIYRPKRQVQRSLIIQ